VLFRSHPLTAIRRSADSDLFAHRRSVHVRQ